MPNRSAKSVTATLDIAREREEETLDAILKARVEEALADPAPLIPQVDVFAALCARHARRQEA